MPLQARSTLLGSPVTVLDQLSGPSEETTLPDAGSHWVVSGISWHPWPHPMWHTTNWMKWKVENTMDDDIPWWQLVALMMNSGSEQTKGLAKCLLVAWQWRLTVNVVDFCPPNPSMLDISQLLDEGADLKDSAA